MGSLKKYKRKEIALSSVSGLSVFSHSSPLRGSGVHCDADRLLVERKKGENHVTAIEFESAARVSTRG